MKKKSGAGKLLGGKTNQRIQNLMNTLGINNFMPFADFNGGVAGSSELSNTNPLSKNLRYTLVSNLRTVLAQAYVEIGLLQTIVDVPVDDALRGGIEIRSKQLDTEQIDELSQAMDEHDDLNNVCQTAKWSRLFGGGALLPMIEDQDPKSPLDLSLITEKTKVNFKDADMWELYWDHQGWEKGFLDESDPSFLSTNPEFYSYYSLKVHKSRVMRFMGPKAPSWVRPRLRGWGMSVAEALVRSINQYLKGQNVTYEITDEAKIDYYLLSGLAGAMMTPQGSIAAKERIALANYMKNFKNAVILDSNDKFEQKQLSFAGLADIAAGARIQVAADMRMPLTKIFGISAAGFNSGEDDIEVYNGTVESGPRRQMKRPIIEVMKIRCQQLFGMIPDDLSFNFKALRILSTLDEETVKTQKFARVLQAAESNRITDLEWRNMVNKDELLPMKLATDDKTLQTVEELKAQPPADGLPGAEGPAPGKSGKVEKEAPKAKEPPEAKN